MQHSHSMPELTACVVKSGACVQQSDMTTPCLNHASHVQVVEYLSDLTFPHLQHECEHFLNIPDALIQTIICHPECVKLVLGMAATRLHPDQKGDEKQIKCVKQCQANLMSIPVEQLSDAWITDFYKHRSQIHNIGLSTEQSDLLKALDTRGADDLLARFGDLEAVLSGINSIENIPEDQPPLSHLLTLPYDCMLALVSQDNLKVASENTVAAAVNCYCIRNTMKGLQTQQLIQQLRPCHMTPGYVNLLGSIIPNLHKSAAGTWSELLARSLTQMLAADDDDMQYWYRHRRPFEKTVPHLPRAAASAAGTVTVHLVQDLKALYAACVTSPKIYTTRSDRAFLNGLWWYIMLECHIGRCVGSDWCCERHCI